MQAGSRRRLWQALASARRLASTQQPTTGATTESAAAEAAEDLSLSERLARRLYSFVSQPSTSEKAGEGGAEGNGAAAARPKTPVAVKPAGLSRRDADARAARLFTELFSARSLSERLQRAEGLCHHLVHYPESRRRLDADGAIPAMLRLHKAQRDEGLVRKTRQLLALLGHTPPLKGAGIRLLSIDGGGTRGVMTLELLAALEAASGRRIHELFDLVVGVSTGAIIATLLTAQGMTVEQARQIYQEMSVKLFDVSRLSGVSGLVFNRSYYDTQAWVTILKEAVGEQFMWDSAARAETPKLCFVSCVVNRAVLEPFIFRNFHQPGSRGTAFPGGLNARLWEALQASAAAPGYFAEVKLGELLFQDGGVLANNPTNIGIHEARVLWGESTPLECVVSLGNGRCFLPHHPATPADSSSWKDVLIKMVDSATDTEMTHQALSNLLPNDRYFRLNPYCSTLYYLDEIDPLRTAAMRSDAAFYVRKNQRKIEAVARKLTRPKPLHKRLAHLWDDALLRVLNREK